MKKNVITPCTTSFVVYFLFFAKVFIVFYIKHNMLQVPPMQYILVRLEKLTVAQIILRNPL